MSFKVEVLRRPVVEKNDFFSLKTTKLENERRLSLLSPNLMLHVPCFNQTHSQAFQEIGLLVKEAGDIRRRSIKTFPLINRTYSLISAVLSSLYSVYVKVVVFFRICLKCGGGLRLI